MIIFDNLENVEAAREWWPRLSGGGVRVLVTARRGDWRWVGFELSVICARAWRRAQLAPGDIERLFSVPNLDAVNQKPGFAASAYGQDPGILVWWKGR